MKFQERIKNAIHTKRETKHSFDLFQLIRENLNKAHKRYFKHLISMIILIIAFILSFSWSSEPIPIFAGFKINDPHIVKALFPGLIGYTFYCLCCYFSMIIHLRSIHDEFAKVLFPRFAKNDLIAYLKPIYPFYSAEGIAFNTFKSFTISKQKKINNIIYSLTVFISVSFEVFILYKSFPISRKFVPYYFISGIVGMIFFLFALFILIRCMYINNK